MRPQFRNREPTGETALSRVPPRPETPVPATRVSYVRKNT